MLNGLELPVDAHEDFLENVLHIGWPLDAPRDESAQALVEFAPYSFRLRGLFHRIHLASQLSCLRFTGKCAAGYILGSIATDVLLRRPAALQLLFGGFAREEPLKVLRYRFALLWGRRWLSFVSSIHRRQNGVYDHRHWSHSVFLALIYPDPTIDLTLTATSFPAGSAIALPKLESDVTAEWSATRQSPVP